jgi:hypothetical protein
MNLPSLVTPHFNATIPSTGQEIEYRPFLVKEEKILLMALEGGDKKEITKATKNIIKSCVIDKININHLATFDIEYLFLKLRGKSVGEVIKVKVGHSDEDSECKHRTEVSINLDDIKVTADGVEAEEASIDNRIMITDDIGVVLRYPGIDDIDKIDESAPESMFDVINNCVEYVFDKDNVYNDFTKKEIKDWVDSLSQKQFMKMSEFFNTIPKLTHNVEWTCSECGKKDSIILEGLQSFFM